MKTMTARFPGKCARTGAPIRPGDLIVFLGKGRAYLSDLIPAIDPDLALARSIDPELADSDPDAAAQAGRYLRQSLERGVSRVWNSGGREYFRNRRGRCEDAPCCGCCNA
jgi:hypothetical protein